MDKKTPSLKHLAIIPDGNRRWARERGRPILEGHQAGFRVLKQAAVWCRDFGIEYLTIFAFSRDNWKRSEKEIDCLVKLAIKLFSREVQWALEEDIQIRVAGDRPGLSAQIQRRIKEAEEKTRSNNKLILTLALNYNGRSEIVEAFRQIIKQGKKAGEINEDLVSRSLWTAGLPDPDMIIRTSGEQRLSGFLTWQSIYSELYFLSKYWPDFNKGDLETALDDYKQRSRRFGR